MAEPNFYFAASLPFLKFEETPKVLLNDFLSQAESFLSSADFKGINDLLAMSENVTLADRGFRAIYAEVLNFQNAITVFRARRAAKDPADFTKGYYCSSAYLEAQFHLAAKEEDLLSAQKIVDKAKWQILDDILSVHYGDSIFFGVYALKLQILQRYVMVHTPKGAELLDEYKTQCMPQKI